MLPIFNPKIIQDYNEEGNENVPSEDFDAGFGCVPVEVERKPAPLPLVPQRELTDHEKWSIMENKRTEEERQFLEDEYLKMYGI